MNERQQVQVSQLRSQELELQRCTSSITGASAVKLTDSKCRCLCQYQRNKNVHDLLFTLLREKFPREHLNAFHKLLQDLRNWHMTNLFNVALLHKINTPWIGYNLFLMNFREAQASSQGVENCGLTKPTLRIRHVDAEGGAMYSVTSAGATCSIRRAGAS